MERTLRMNIVKRKFLLLAGASIVIIGLFDSCVFTGGGARFYYHRGRFFGPGFLWFDAAVDALMIGAVIEALPYGSTVVTIGGGHYFFFNGTYFRPCPGGYIVVARPTTAVAPPTGAAQTPTSSVAPAPEIDSMKSLGNLPGDSAVVINVPDKNGSYTPVTLLKHGKGYIGPQGEFYAGHPTVDQLKALYGK